MKNEDLNSIDLNDIELRDGENLLPLERRDFLKVLGGGIVVFMTVGDGTVLADPILQRRGYPSDFNAYLRIGEDGRVTVYTGKVELGQGVMTSQAQMLADELGVAFESIDMLMGDTDLCPWDSGTYGSLTTRTFGPYLRAAGARARSVLMDLASEQFEIPKDGLSVENGTIFVTADRNRKVTYADLAKGQAIARTLEEEAVLKSVSEFAVMGKSYKRLDAVEKVTGEAEFAGDIRMPGMLYAKIFRPPSHSTRIRSVDTSRAGRIPGVVIVNEEDLVAALHEDPEMAERALRQFRADMYVPDAVLDNENIFEHLLANAPEGRQGDVRGDLSVGESEASFISEEQYLDGYVAHSPMEPHTALASLENGKMTVWVSTQAPFSDQGRVARAIGFPPENVRIITPYVGGGFGGKTSNLQAVEAARLAQITGRPVQVAWSRAEEFFLDTFRPAAIVKIKSGVDESGKICLWDYNVYFAGSRGSDQLYDARNNSITTYGEWGRGGSGTHPLSVGAWRAPGANTNVFAKESHIDVMAARAGIDPLEFRLNNTSDDRLINVLNAVAEKFGWTPAPAPSGRGYGLACGIDAGTYVAHMAEVGIDRQSGRITVKRVVCAQDMGIVINPDGAAMQMEGCITMGLGYALSEDLRFRGDEVLDRNFDTYEIPRFSWMPEIETVILENDELAPQGGGEPAIIAMGAVIANAIYDAVGARLFQLPMTPERVLEGMRYRR
jgi:isoquinoline 1-oxidoreductase